MSGRRSRRGVIHFLLLGVSAGVFAVVAAIAALVLIVPAVTGSVALTVLTSSMEPGLPPGSMVVVRPTDPADVRIGSIITFQWESGNPTLVTHRVVGVITDADGGYAFTTQGDNNDEPDPNPVGQEQLRGVVWYSLPLLGWVANLTSGELRPILVPVLAGALFVYAAVLVVQALRGRRPALAPEAGASAGRRARVRDGASAAQQPEGGRRATFVAPSDEPRPAHGRRSASAPRVREQEARAPGLREQEAAAPMGDARADGEQPPMRPRGARRARR
ncbi:signal peptidase I [Arenivirga flava]|uniref:Signal peptidase I n=1 Tax=Arenivirga flava TaxID=1930060 RepID=A0AA37UHY5_9MICO|nr:signal peptidase I [Arenivirga flava]GMA29620.1 hypothetical protein GCM10025874_28730 [Arenivirga flava]